MAGVIGAARESITKLVRKANADGDLDGVRGDLSAIVVGLQGAAEATGFDEPFDRQFTILDTTAQVAKSPAELEPLLPELDSMARGVGVAVPVAMELDEPEGADA